MLTVEIVVELQPVKIESAMLNIEEYGFETLSRECSLLQTLFRKKKSLKTT